MGFVKYFGMCNALKAELWGVYEGLKFTCRLGFKRIEVNVDYSIIVNILENGYSLGIDGMSLLNKSYY